MNTAHRPRPSPTLLRRAVRRRTRARAGAACAPGAAAARGRRGRARRPGRPPAPLAGAVVAPAQVKVELNRKTVQHQEGGIVREILVREGQAVRAGEALLVVGDLRTDAELALLQDQRRAARLRGARASAEAALSAAMAVPPDLQRRRGRRARRARARAVRRAPARARRAGRRAARAGARRRRRRPRRCKSQIAPTEDSARLPARSWR